MTAPVEHRVEGSRGRSLRVLVWAAPKPKARVQIVHGYSEHVARYEPVARRLVEAGYTVFGHDQVGHGASEGTPGVLERFMDLVDDLRVVEEAATEWTGLDTPRVLIGHSLGGLVVIRHLQTGGGPCAGVVLSAPWLATRVRVPAVKRWAGKLLWRIAPDLTIPNEIDPTLLSRDPEVQARRLVDPLAHARVSAGFFERGSAAQREALAGGVPGTAPVRILVPGDDGVADAEVTRRWAAGLGDRVEVVPLPGVRHEPFNDTARNEILDSLVEWMDALREVDTGTASTPPSAGDRAGDE